MLNALPEYRSYLDMPADVLRALASEVEPGPAAVGFGGLLRATGPTAGARRTMLVLRYRGALQACLAGARHGGEPVVNARAQLQVARERLARLVARFEVAGRGDFTSPGRRPSPRPPGRLLRGWRRASANRGSAAALRLNYTSGNRSGNYGFRVARTLTPWVLTNILRVLGDDPKSDDLERSGTT